MSYDYKTLISLPEKLSLVVLIRFLGDIQNSSLGPASIEKDSDRPPVFFFWFKENNDEVNELIAKAVQDYPWEVEWCLEPHENNKWLLFPEHLKDAERIIQNSDDENIQMTRNSVAWLVRNEPEFGRRANKDLDNFRKYFRKIVENYLKQKESLN